MNHTVTQVFLCPRRSTDRSLCRGLSLLEIMVVVTILAILLSLCVPLISLYKRRSEDLACMGNLRSLHTSFGAYLLDHSMVWPQPNEGLINDASDAEDDNDQLTQFWITTLEPYGAHRQTWLCPSERSTFKTDFDEKRYDASYAPTPFDKTPNIAYEWGRQPWLIERGGFHGGEANRVMPDGSIQKQYLPIFAQ
jgi:prepilin-type N-terminal cleavage/methylation domain-containing protein